MQIANTLPELIGNTPLLRLERFAPGAGVLAKLESFNPLSSAKDRAGLYMILDAEERGLLQPGAVIVEPTSGNTGVALAYIGRQRGYRVVLTMPETMSQERRSLLAALGAELVLTEGARGMGGAIERAKELLESTPGAWMPDQFNNPANARAHYETTGPELWRDTDGGVDVLVAGVGSGGTITGAGRYLKEQNPAIRVVAVEPAAGEDGRLGRGPIRSRASARASSPAPWTWGWWTRWWPSPATRPMPPPGSWPVPRGCWPGCPPARRPTRPASWPSGRTCGARPSRWCSPILASATSLQGCLRK